METQVVAETILSLIPSLVKMSPLSTPDLTLIRLLTVSGVSLVGAQASELYALDIQQWIIPTAITITHIVSSYLGFKKMPNVWSQVIFYSYPFMILVGSYLILNESIRLFDVLWFVPLFFFIYLLYTETIDPSSKQKKTEMKEMSSFDWTVGTAALLISAATEAAYFLYFMYYPIQGSWNRLGVSYIGAAILYTIYYFVTKQNKKHRSKSTPPVTTGSWVFALAWNLVIAGFGYWARFYSINKVPPLLFSGISYIGLITGYVFAVLFGIDVLTKVDVISIAGVLISILGLTFTPYIMGSESLLIS